MCVCDNRCLENVYTLCYQQTLARLQHAEVIAASDDAAVTDDDDDDDDKSNDESMKID